MTRRKYGNQPVEADGHRFDSKAEYHRYLVLQDRESRNEIECLKVHPRFVLLPGFVDAIGRVHRKIAYVGDFLYREVVQDTIEAVTWEDHPDPPYWVVEDVKGGKATQTQVFKVKMKLLLASRPDLVFRIVEM